MRKRDPFGERDKWLRSEEAPPWMPQEGIRDVWEYMDLTARHEALELWPVPPNDDKGGTK